MKYNKKMKYEDIINLCSVVILEILQQNDPNYRIQSLAIAALQESCEILIATQTKKVDIFFTMVWSSNDMNGRKLRLFGVPNEKFI